VSIPGSVLGGYVALTLWIAGYKYTDASVASILNRTNTIFAMILAAIFLKEAFTRRKIVAVILAMGGIALVFLGSDRIRNGQQQVGRVGPAKVEGVQGFPRFLLSSGAFRGIRIWLEARRIAARNRKAEPVSFVEDQACGPEIDFDCIHFARFHEPALCKGIPVPHPEDPVAYEEGAAVRIDIGEFCGEVRVRCVRGDPEFRFHLQPQTNPLAGVPA